MFRFVGVAQSGLSLTLYNIYGMEKKELKGENIFQDGENAHCFQEVESSHVFVITVTFALLLETRKSLP